MGTLCRVVEPGERRGKEHASDAIRESVARGVQPSRSIPGILRTRFTTGSLTRGALAAVVLCDFCLLGTMVSPKNIDRLRSFDFDIAGLAQPLTPEGVTTQVESYDPAEAGRVRDLLRSGCGLEQAVAELVGRTNW